MKNLLLRSVTGIIYIAVIVCGIMLPSPAIWVLIFLLAVGAASEYHQLTQKLGSSGNSPLMFFDTLGVMSVSLLAATAATPGGMGVISMIMFIVLYMLSRPIVALYNADMKKSLVDLGFAMLALVYIGLPLCCMGWMSLMNGGRWLLLGMFILIWLNDTGAFIIGSMLGSKKLFERLSPKKSWEGFFGGLVFCIIGGVVYYYCARSYIPERISAVDMGVYGAVVAAVATWGDLFESMLKRAAGVKDSGTLLPGHGGVLDRIDSFLLVAPVTVIYMTIAQIN